MGAEYVPPFASEDALSPEGRRERRKAKMEYELLIKELMEKTGKSLEIIKEDLSRFRSYVMFLNGEKDAVIGQITKIYGIDTFVVSLSDEEFEKREITSFANKFQSELDGVFPGYKVKIEKSNS